MGDRWQIFLFDGGSIRQLTDGDVSVHAEIEGDEIVYARQDAQGNWRALRHSLGTEQAVIIKEGHVAKRPKFRDGVVVSLGI